ncbi:hypothetical protein KUL42_11600 [Alteromonas sp. KUL42]|nr:hypothetical protein KUL42_11600 [Alteromonas sp. KUL42]
MSVSASVQCETVCNFAIAQTTVYAFVIRRNDLTVFKLILSISIKYKELLFMGKFTYAFGLS